VERASENPYVNGATKYNAAIDGILCVDHGGLGHIATNCSGANLSNIERDILRNTVFSPKYVRSKAARLYNAGLPINDQELRTEVLEMYLEAGFTPDGKYRAPEGSPTVLRRSAALVVRDTSTPGHVIEVASRMGKMGVQDQWDIAFGKGMRIINAYAGSGSGIESTALKEGEQVGGSVTQSPTNQLGESQPLAAPGRGLPPPLVPRKQVAVEDIIDKEVGGRPVHPVVR